MSWIIFKALRYQNKKSLNALSGYFELTRHRGDEGLRLLHGLEANLATSLQTPQEA